MSLLWETQLSEGAVGDVLSAASAAAASSCLIASSNFVSVGLFDTAARPAAVELSPMKSDRMSRNRPQNRSGMVIAVR